MSQADEVSKLQSHLSLLREEYVKLQNKLANTERKCQVALAQAGVNGETQDGFVSRLLKFIADLFDKEQYRYMSPIVKLLFLSISLKSKTLASFFFCLCFFPILPLCLVQYFCLLVIIFLIVLEIILCLKKYDYILILVYIYSHSSLLCLVQYFLDSDSIFDNLWTAGHISCHLQTKMVCAKFSNYFANV